eukprot:TRINITY_DN75176_c0_g1_i1.p1 TRINITY_DN75176_c0_g1~~TRINITY_DN75176_c0_g1_i1.p1  ORF type:complete len:435 (-),score=79.21 TRINITY_DN75176_c0_g1_i1:214-1518(-)
MVPSARLPVPLCAVQDDPAQNACDEEMVDPSVVSSRTTEHDDGTLLPIGTCLTCAMLQRRAARADAQAGDLAEQLRQSRAEVITWQSACQDARLELINTRARLEVACGKLERESREVHLAMLAAERHQSERAHWEEEVAAAAGEFDSLRKLVGTASAARREAESREEVTREACESEAHEAEELRCLVSRLQRDVGRLGEEARAEATACAAHRGAREEWRAAAVAAATSFGTPPPRKTRAPSGSKRFRRPPTADASKLSNREDLLRLLPGYEDDIALSPLPLDDRSDERRMQGPSRDTNRAPERRPGSVSSWNSLLFGEDVNDNESCTAGAARTPPRLTQPRERGQRTEHRTKGFADPNWQTDDSTSIAARAAAATASAKAALREELAQATFVNDERGLDGAAFRRNDQGATRRKESVDALLEREMELLESLYVK